MIRALVVAFFTLMLSVYSSSAAEPIGKSKELETMIMNFRKYFLDFPAKKEVPEYVASCRDDGSWKDIDYSSKDRSGWQPMSHVDRVYEITLATFNSDAVKEEHQRNLDAIHRALAYWRKHDFKSDNWWCNNIGAPERFGRIAIIMGDSLTAEEKDYIVNTVLPRAAIGMTGQNKVWLCGNTIMRAVLVGDVQTIKKASDIIWDEVCISDKEGIKPDFSFQQHGAMLQFGNYGLAYANDISKWAIILSGTPWAMPADKLDIFRKYVFDGQNWIVWRGSMDISSCGRQLMPRSPETKASSAMGLMKRMMTVDPANSTEYKSFLDRNQQDAENDLAGNKYFWCSDYMIHRRKDFFTSLKMCSSRIIGMESINNENLLGWHLGDGALYVSRAGGEYKDIFPVWDWKKLPGITCVQTPGDPERSRNWKNTNDFVGGVSDGVFGCAAMDLERDGVSFNKSWFFADDKIFCFGSGISSSLDSPAATAVNQCLLRGEVKARIDGKEQILQKGKKAYADVEWVEHDGLRYAFAKPCTVNISTGSQDGNWSRVFKNSQTPKGKISKEVFSVWIDHGKKPESADYLYVILPSGKEMDPSDIVMDKPSLHAVRLTGGTVAASFREAGKFEYEKGRFVEVGSPCLLMLDAEGRTVTLSDPTHKLKSMDVNIDGKSIKVALPSGGNAGKSVKAAF
ncbi:MAG TPA: hypothetical protein DET40_03275 [Lentisphaeria bacterium]|nr:MAG: hypothetical protein A2X45_22215 [Lentisphaerae bacterium GWF2_50_93]HCE42552.1 hypothetical protein [Lentisphaeria bacterium]